MLRCLFVAGCVVSLLPVAVQATDTAAVIAAFKDPKAECRYLKTLCDGLWNAAEHSSPQDAAQRLRAWNESVDVVTAKRGQRPACAHCPGID